MKVLRCLCLFFTCFIGFSNGEIPAPATPAPEKPAEQPTATSPTPTPKSESTEIQETQLKGPDILQLSSDGKKELTLTGNENIKALFKSAENLSADANKTLLALSKPYEEFTKKFEDLNKQIDKFFQESSFNKGKNPKDASKEPLDPINKIINDIKAIKKTLKDQIKEFDQKLAEARAAQAPMHKESLKILSTTKEAEAQAIVNNINNDLGKINTIQSFITGDFTTKFNNDITKIEELLKQGEAAGKKLLQPQEEKKPIKKTKPKQKPVEKKEAKPETEAKTQEPEPEGVATTTPEPEPIKEAVTKIEEPKKETYRDSITAFLAKISLGIKNFFTGAKNIVSADNNIQPETQPEPQPKWKQLTMHVVGQILDAGAYVCNGIISTCKSIYNYFFAPTVDKFVSDVKEKIKEEEKQSPKKA